MAGLPDMTRSRQKRRPARSGPRRTIRRSTGRSRSPGIDLGEVVLRGLRTVGNELAEIFGGRLGTRDEHLAARPGEIRLDLDRFGKGLGGRQLVDAREEGFGILEDRLLDVAGDLGSFADGIGNRGL